MVKHFSCWWSPKLLSLGQTMCYFLARKWSIGASKFRPRSFVGPLLRTTELSTSSIRSNEINSDFSSLWCYLFYKLGCFWAFWITFDIEQLILNVTLFLIFMELWCCGLLAVWFCYVCLLVICSTFWMMYEMILGVHVVYEINGCIYVSVKPIMCGVCSLSCPNCFLPYFVGYEHD